MTLSLSLRLPTVEKTHDMGLHQFIRNLCSGNVPAMILIAKPGRLRFAVMEKPDTISRGVAAVAGSVTGEFA